MKRICQRIFYLSCFWQPSESDWAVSSMCFPMVPHFEMKNINIFYLIRSCMCAIDSKCICQLMWLQYLLYIWLLWLGQKLFNFTHLNTAFRWPGAWKRWSPQGSGKLGGCIVMHHCSPNHSNKDHIWELIWLFAVIIKCKWWPPQKDYQTPLLPSAISSSKMFFWSCFWQPSESDWAVSSMCFPILPHFERKNISTRRAP